jgi:hypothetical protein
MDNEEYERMFALVESQKITEEVWFDYCFKVLAKILNETKDVMIRLKNR